MKAKLREGMNLRLEPKLKNEVRRLAQRNHNTLLREIVVALEKHVAAAAQS